MAALLATDGMVAVWHWTPTEAVSAIERRRREGLSEREADAALARLDAAVPRWLTVDDHDLIRDAARRCLRRHPLRTADAGQLAAAMVLAERLGRTLSFVSLDERLARAALLEGLQVLPAR